MIEKLINKPIAVTMSLIALVILSVMAIQLIPVSIAPDVDIPKITVTINAGNYTARELENVAVKSLRNQLMQINNIDNIHAETKDGISNIYIKFNHGTDVDYAFIEVNEKIDRAMNNFPREINRPTAIKASATDIPAFYLNVSLKNKDENFKKSELYPVSPKFTELTNFVRHVLIKRIEQLPEIAIVDATGYVNNQILIIPDQQKLKSLNISNAEIEKAINDNNISLGNISIRDGEYVFKVRFDSKVYTKEDFENIYLNISDKVFRLADLSEIHFHPQRIISKAKTYDEDCISLAIIKNTDSQMADLKINVEKLMKNIKNDYPEINVEIVRDQTILLEYLISNLVSNILVGALLACLILFVFIKDVKTPFLIIISIPISLILSMLIFYMFGITINIISLSGLVLGVGMMVDNSIVVIDNITQLWERGMPLKKAAARGAGEMFPAMLSSVLTTCSVFIPLIFMSGISGALFYDQAMSITITLFSSLFVAVLVIPVYYTLFFKSSLRRENSKFLSKVFSFDYHAGYEKMMVWFLRRQWVVLVSFIAFAVAGYFLFQILPKENLPRLTENDTVLTIDWNDKISIEENERRIVAINDFVINDVEQMTAIIGNSQYMLSHAMSGSLQTSEVYLKVKDSTTVAEVKRKMSDYIEENYKNVIFSFRSTGNIFDMIFSNDQAQLIANIRTTNGLPAKIDELNMVVDEISKAISTTTIEPISYQEQVELIVRHDMLAMYGISHSLLISSLKSAFSSNTLFSVSNGQNNIDIVLGANNYDIDDILSKTMIVANKDATYPVGAFLKESKSLDYKLIVSDSGGDYYPINIDVQEFEVEEAMAKIDNILDTYKNFDVSYAGNYFSSREMISELMMILVVSILLLFFILATQFESLVQPFVIMSEILIDLVGAFIALWIAGASINLMSMIGIIVMSGIVINDSILKIDTINRLRGEGYGLLRAIMTGGIRRLTPIIMTSLTTILAVAPFLMTGDLGSDLQYPLSVALIGGMIIGTIVSIFFVPVIYYQIYKNKK